MGSKWTPVYLVINLLQIYVLGEAVKTKALRSLGCNYIEKMLQDPGGLKNTMDLCLMMVERPGNQAQEKVLNRKQYG